MKVESKFEIASRSGLALVATLAVAALVGCGGGSKSADTGSSTPAPATTAAAKADSDTTVVIRVHDPKGCVEFVPTRSKVWVGQPVAWVANPDLKETVLIHLPAGAFKDTIWTLNPNGRVDAGPAITAGTYSYSTLNLCKITDAGGPGVDIGDHTQP
jgi:hypothetical protein